MGRNSPLNPKDKANVFNQFFRSVFNKRIDNLSSVHPIHDLTGTPSEVLKVLVIVSVARTWADVLVIPRGPGLAPELVVSNTLDKTEPQYELFQY